MPSKFEIWEINALKVFDGLTVLYSPLETLDNLIIESLAKTNVLRRYNAEEIEQSWLQDQLFNLSLFESDTTEIFLINRSQMLNKSKIEILMAGHKNLTKRVVLLFHKENDGLKRLKKEIPQYCQEIKRPAFWNLYKVLSFHLKLLDIECDERMIQRELSDKELEVKNIIDLVNRIKIFHHQLDLKDIITNYFKEQSLGHFKTLELIEKKKFINFYQECLTFGSDMDGLRQLVLSAQGHLLKLNYPSYQSSKSKLSKVDHSINQSKTYWSKAELSQVISELQKLETLAKLRPDSVRGVLTQLIIKQY